MGVNARGGQWLLSERPTPSSEHFSHGLGEFRQAEGLANESSHPFIQDALVIQGAGGLRLWQQRAGVRLLGV